jgi:hypothetical protein
MSLRQAVPQSMPANVASAGKRTSERITPSALDSDTFCAVCGVESAQRENGSCEGPIINGCSCHTSPMLRLPLLDVDPMARTQSQHHPNVPVSPKAERGVLRWSIREILAATDPAQVFAVRCIMAQLKLSCFPESESASVSGAGALDPSGTASPPTVAGCDIIALSILTSTAGPVSESLASCAVLALAVREFARRLIDSAVTAFTSDRTRGKESPRVLSLAHVSRGVTGSFLTRGVLAEPPPSPFAIALTTLVQHRLREPTPPSVIMDTSRIDRVSAVRSQSYDALDGSVDMVEG